MWLVHEIIERWHSFLAAVHIKLDDQIGSQLALELLPERIELKHV